MSIDLYGIKNCDTVKKARKWLEQQQIEYTFHDFRADGIEQKSICHWEKNVGVDLLINKRSTTWKQLDDEAKAHFAQTSLNKAAIDIILQNPTLIKRPVLQTAEQVVVGFNADQYNNILN